MSTAILWDAINDYVRASENAMTDTPEHGAKQRQVTARAELEAVIDSLFSPMPEDQQVWIVNDAKGEHVMLCPKAPTSAYLARVSEEAGSECTVTAYMLRPVRK